MTGEKGHTVNQQDALSKNRGLLGFVVLVGWFFYTGGWKTKILGLQKECQKGC